MTIQVSRQNRNIVSNQQGYGNLAILLIIVGLVVIGLSGWLVYKSNAAKEQTPSDDNSNVSRQNNATTEQTSEPKYKSFTSSDSVFSLSYPDEWNDGAGFLANQCGAIECIGSISFLPADKSTSVNLMEVKSSLSSKDWFNQTISPTPSEVKDTNNNSINGYQTYYAKVANESYTDHHYAFSRNGYVVYVSFREKDTHYKENGQIDKQLDHSQYKEQFTQIAKSIKFGS